jgi:tetratricopeptide (TPR) repeat protein
MRRLSLVFATLLLTTLLACDGDKPTKHPDEPEDDLGDGKLDGRGPGGIGDVMAGKADADPKVVEAEALLAEGKYEQALATIDDAIAKNPNLARFHYVRGNALSYLNRDADARAAYEKAIALDETDALPHAGLGNLIAFQADAKLEHRSEAIPHFQAALKLDPNLAVAHQALGICLLSLGKLQEAVEALETADRLYPNVETAYGLAQAHAELGNDQKALAYAKSAIEYEPEQSGVDLRLLYARLLAKNAQPKDAAREFEQAAKLGADSPLVRFEVARGLLELGELDAAMVHMQWLLEAAPKEAPVWVNYGRLLIAQGKPKDAIAQFDKALELDPTSQAAQTYKIEALVGAKRCKDARAQFDKLAKQLEWEKGSDKPQPRALVKAQGFLDAGKCK